MTCFLNRLARAAGVSSSGEEFQSGRLAGVLGPRVAKANAVSAAPNRLLMS